MRFESWRLSTFSHVQNRLAVSTLRLANSGFYYDEERDDIACFSCNLRKRDWDTSDAVTVVQLELSPDCDQANFRDARNVPVSKYSHVGPTDESSVLPGLSQQTHHGSRDDWKNSTTPSIPCATWTGPECCSKSERLFRTTKTGWRAGWSLQQFWRETSSQPRERICECETGIVRWLAGERTAQSTASGHRWILLPGYVDCWIAGFYYLGILISTYFVYMGFAV